MRRTTMLAAAGLAAAFLLALGGTTTRAQVEKAAPRGAVPKDLAAAGIEGPYLQDGDMKHAVTITALGNGAYRIDADEWEGVGLFDGKSYWGVYRYREGVAPPAGVGASGTHRGSLGPDGSIHIHGESVDGRGHAFDTVWKPERPKPPNDRRGLPTPGFQHPVWPPDTPPIQVTPTERPPVEVAPPDVPRDGLPNLGDYVYVEELPEAIKKVPPVYPELPVKVEGTVLVQALVGKDGLVKDTRVIRSVPMLDEAAVESVRRWVFKPAMAKGKPVAVWVAIPVRFAPQ